MQNFNMQLTNKVCQWMNNACIASSAVMGTVFGTNLCVPRLLEVKGDRIRGIERGS